MYFLCLPVILATFLRPLSYRYQWLYDMIAQIAALSVGGEDRFRHLPIAGLELPTTAKALDLCCGSGQSTRILVKHLTHVTGLDISPVSLQRAKNNVPQAEYLEADATAIPLPDQSLDLVHTSAALHEMTPEALGQITQEVWRVLKPGGYFVLVDFHRPTNWLFLPGIWLFFWLFETATAWQLINLDLPGLLEQVSFQVSRHQLYAGGSLQVIQARKPPYGHP